MQKLNNVKLLTGGLLLGALISSNTAYAIDCGLGSYENSESYSSGPLSFTIEWNICGFNELEMKMTGSGDGWIGVGFSDDQFMANSDTIIGGIENDGTAYLTDTWSFGHTTPSVDASQNVTLVSARESGGNTIVEFTRPLDTGDASEDIRLDDAPRYLMWAIGPVDYNGIHSLDNHGISGRGVSSGRIDFTVVSDQAINGFSASPSSGEASGSSTLSATASSTLAVSFASNTPTICTVSGSTANYLAAGTCTVTANQAGNDDYNAAPETTLNITVSTTSKLDQNITNYITNPGTAVFAGTSSLSANGGASGNPVTFSSATPVICTVAGNVASYIAPGTCSLLADQAGNTTYDSAPQVTLNVNVGLAAQTIPEFTVTPSNAVINGSSSLNTSASSGLLVIFSSTTPAVCSVSNNTVNYIAAGSCEVTANQEGNTNYAAAPQLTQNINVSSTAVMPTKPIPTLSQWSLILLSLGILSIGGMISQRRRSN